MSRMNNLLAAMIPLAIMSEMNSPLDANSKTSIGDIDFTPKVPPVPKGCKRYYFNEDGLCEQRNGEVYFDALKFENAHNKWYRWLQKQGAV